MISGEPLSSVEAERVSVQYRRGGGLAELSLTVAPGEYLAVFGGTGSGKSTLLKLLAGRLTSETGSLRVLGKSPRGSAKRIGHVLEGDTISGLATPHAALGQALARQDIPGTQRPARIAEMLELFDLYDVRDQPTRELSTGRRQALRLACALAPRPALLLLDNPTISLPIPIAERLFQHVNARRAAEGLTVLYATTSSSEAERADRVLLLDNGCLLADEAPDPLISRHTRETLTIEATDPAAVQRTLRGLFDIRMEETGEGLRFTVEEGLAATAYLFRHPSGGVRTIYIKRPTLWDVLDALR